MMRPRWTFFPLRGRRAAAGGATLLVSGAAVSAVPTQLKVDDPGYQRALKTVEEGYEDRSLLSPSERLRLMFLKDEEGHDGPEMQFVWSVTGISFFAGVVFGAYSHGSRDFKQFMVENKHTMFERPQDAQQAMREVLVKSMAKGGVKWGVRMAAVSGFYTTICTLSTVYRNKVSPFDHMLAGTLLGACYRLTAGPRAAIGAAAAGCGLGFVGGVATTLMQWASGETVEERWRREFKHQRAKKVTEFNPDELASPATLQIPSDRREEKLESIDEQSIFVRAYFAGRRALGIKDKWQDYDYSYLEKPKDSEE